MTALTEILAGQVVDLIGRLARTVTALDQAHIDHGCTCPAGCVLRDDWVVDARRGRP